MRPTDKAYRALVSTCDRAYDQIGNKFRHRVLERIEADEDGCWIWRGTVNWVHGRDGTKPYPRFRFPHVGQTGWRHTTPLLYILEQWAPDQLAQLAKGRTYRVCRKTLCVRPQCVTRKQPYRTLPAGEIYRLRMVERLGHQAIADKLGLTYKQVAEMCRRNDWIFTRRQSLDKDQVFELIEMGLSTKEIAAKLACDPSAINMWRKKWRARQESSHPAELEPLRASQSD